ncbi:hypothetical protein SASPL_118297 [Salvia splendens]|uniref:Uncharacterized protein n=1 Tax=Salvia splendens TaxID=180675 RepID=A0A8X8XWH0_SALSN|nr:hypothetical protein SASPL_118297 [Salvia splendens]
MFTKITNLAAVYVIILVIFHHPVSRVTGANARLPLLVNPQTLRMSEYVTLTGALCIARRCSSDCDVACCYCDITTQPPVCIQCCKGDP